MVDMTPMYNCMGEARITCNQTRYHLNNLYKQKNLVEVNSPGQFHPRHLCSHTPHHRERLAKTTWEQRCFKNTKNTYFNCKLYIVIIQVTKAIQMHFQTVNISDYLRLCTPHYHHTVLHQLGSLLKTYSSESMKIYEDQMKYPPQALSSSPAQLPPAYGWYCRGPVLVGGPYAML